MQLAGKKKPLRDDIRGASKVFPFTDGAVGGVTFLPSSLPLS